MGRKRRDLTESTWIHVFNRGSDRQDIFSDPADFALFERLIGEEFARLELEVHAYALMTNHFHLLVNCPAGGLSAGMQRLCGRYGAAYNHRSERRGPVLGGRFGSVAITDDDQLLTVGRYIHRNPLAFTAPGQLVHYPWSSLSALGGRRVAPDWLAVDSIVTGGMTPAQYREFVLADVEDESSLVQAAANERTLFLVVTAAAEVCDVDVVDVVTSRPGHSSPARMLALTVAVDARVAPVEAVADRFGFTNLGSLRRLARRGRVAIAREPQLRRRYDAIRSATGEPSGSAAA